MKRGHERMSKFFPEVKAKLGEEGRVNISVDTRL